MLSIDKLSEKVTNNTTVIWRFFVMLDDFGSISVRAYTASGALPVADATVIISGAEESNRDVIYALTTDNDGTTQQIKLPAPSVVFSESPGATEAPYAIYDVEISADGYFPKRINSVPIFPGIYSLQPIAMIPQGNGAEDTPKNNLYSSIPESKLT